MDDLYYMGEALTLAREAAAEGEVPVGCVTYSVHSHSRQPPKRAQASEIASISA